LKRSRFTANLGEVTMPTAVDTALRKALVTLRSEKARLERQIVALESAIRSGDGGSPGRIRPGAPARRRRPMSAAARKAIGERMRAYWARRKAAARARPAKKT
jgi:hypothetical protein